MLYCFLKHKHDNNRVAAVIPNSDISSVEGEHVRDKQINPRANLENLFPV